MKTLRSAVIGVGYLGRFHAQKHKALGTLRYVCDVSSVRVQEVAKELQCEGTVDPKQLLGQVDVITVAADTRQHYEICKMFLNAGVHVFVEKPICTTVAEAEDIVALAERKNLKLAVGHIERFNPAFVAGLKYLDQPHYAQVRRLAPFKSRSLCVDVVLDLMIHDIDLVNTLARSKVTNIFAKGAKVITDFNDSCEAWIQYENGFEAFLSSSRVDLKTTRTVQVYDRKGVLDMDLGSQTANRFSQSQGPSATPLQLTALPVSKADAMLSETEAFFQAILNQSEVLVSGLQGLEALRCAEKILELTR